MRSRRASEEINNKSPKVLLKESTRSTDQQVLPRFAWDERWLRGDEYALMLLRIEEYCEKYKLERYGANQHPPQIYQRPQNGSIYFLRGNRLEALAYPRTPDKKTYCWKKMNFPTLLPKADPLVKYLVASSFLSGRMHRDDGPSFRMHVVTSLKFESSYLLCHIRRVSREEEGKGETEHQLPECFSEDGPNFYRLFMLLHNNYHCQ